MNALPDLIGLGLYSIPEAARLAEVAPVRARGWVQGYRDGTASRDGPPLSAMPCRTWTASRHCPFAS